MTSGSKPQRWRRSGIDGALYRQAAGSPNVTDHSRASSSIMVSGAIDWRSRRSFGMSTPMKLVPKSTSSPAQRTALFKGLHEIVGSEHVLSEGDGMIPF